MSKSRYIGDYPVIGIRGLEVIQIIVILQKILICSKLQEL